MSQGAWIRGIIREAVEPLEREIARLHGRLAAVENTDGSTAAQGTKRPARGRTTATQTDGAPAQEAPTGSKSPAA